MEMGGREPHMWPSRELHAMGCQMTVRLAPTPALTAQAVAAALDAAEAHIRAVEGAWSRFDPTSELSRVNAQAGTWTPVSPGLWDLLVAAWEQAAATNGRFDPTLLYAMRAAGYDRSFALLPAAANQAGRAATGAGWRGAWQAVQMDPGTRRIKLPVGVGLDLGGIAKGWVAAQVVDLLRPWGAALVDAGGDVAAGAPAPGYPGWPVALAAPLGWTRVPSGRDGAVDGAVDGAEESLAWVWLREATVATSGVDYRRWEHAGQLAHHILDPRTGAPVQTDLLTVAVVDGQAARAEAWAKAALVMGAEGAYLALCRRGMAALLVEQDGRVWMTPGLRPWLAWEGPRLAASVVVGMAAR